MHVCALYFSAGDRCASLLLPLLASKPQLQLLKVDIRCDNVLISHMAQLMAKNKPAAGKKTRKASAGKK